jgi:Flp pilus assembly protein TadG
MLTGRTRTLRGGRRAVASIEFAAIAPVMFLMVAGVFDLTKAVVLWEQVHNTAHQVAISATNVSINPDGTTSITPSQAQEAMSIIFAQMPWVRQGIETGTRSVTLSSVAFVPITSSSCTQTASNNCYSAQVAWSVGYGGGNQSGVTPFTVVTRSCTPLTQITPTAQLQMNQTPLNTLRTANVTLPDAVIVADVHYKYTPFFLKFLTGAVDFWATASYPARSGSSVANLNLQYTTYTGSNGTQCTVPSTA